MLAKYRRLGGETSWEIVSFHSCVRALWMSGGNPPKSSSGRVFPFPFYLGFTLGRLSLFPFIFPHPPTSYPASAGFIGINIILLVCSLASTSFGLFRGATLASSILGYATHAYSALCHINNVDHVTSVKSVHCVPGSYMTFRMAILIWADDQDDWPNYWKKSWM